jgi:nucleoside-diphosphate-sugar epimerase
MTKLIIGCGYLGRRVARRWLDAGHEVVGLVREPDRGIELARLGIRPLVGDVTRPATLAQLPPAETVLFSVGYRSDTGASRRAVYVEGLRAVLQAIAADTRRVILISSAGVYGAARGRVDEDSPCRPVRESAIALLAAEQLLAAHPLGARGIVLRLAGIYGPGRLPQVARATLGGAVRAVAVGHVNLIHADDAATVVLAAEARAQPPRTFLVSDGHPAVRRDYYACLASTLGLPPPEFSRRPEGASGNRGRGEKLVDNGRMLRELSVELMYPTYREGLAAIP